MKNKYRIVDSFCRNGYQLLVLDRDFKRFPVSKILIDGKKYPYLLNSIKTWVVVHMDQTIQNKEVEFVD